MKRRKSKSKTKSLRVHALRRIEERHKPSAPLLTIISLTKIIRDQNQPQHRNKYIFIDRQSNRVTRWLVLYEGKWYPVVYDSNRKEIITVLPDGALGKTPLV